VIVQDKKKKKKKKVEVATNKHFFDVATITFLPLSFKEEYHLTF